MLSIVNVMTFVINELLNMSFKNVLSIETYIFCYRLSIFWIINKSGVRPNGVKRLVTTITAVFFIVNHL